MFKLNKGETHLTAFDKDAIKYMSPIKREKENSGRCQLKKGETYVIVCATEFQQIKTDFYLSVYFDIPLRDVHLMRTFHPADKQKGKEMTLPTFIPEEAEKCATACPLWKIELVKESLPFMITDEDEGIKY